MDAAPPPDPPDLALLLSRSTYWQLVHTLHASLLSPPTTSPRPAPTATTLPCRGRLAAAGQRRGGSHRRPLRRRERLCDGLPAARPPVPGRFPPRAPLQRAVRQHDAPGQCRALAAAARAGGAAQARGGPGCLQPGRLDPALRPRAAGGGHRHAAPEPPSPPAPDAAKADIWRDLTEAERYAVTYPRRAALIRAHGALPDNCSFGPPPRGGARHRHRQQPNPARPRPAASPRIRLTCGPACHRTRTRTLTRRAARADLSHCVARCPSVSPHGQ